MTVLTGVVGGAGQITGGPFAGVGIVTAVGGGAAATEVGSLGVVGGGGHVSAAEVDGAVVMLATIANGTGTGVRVTVVAGAADVVAA